MTAQILPFQPQILRRALQDQRWRKAGWRLLAACFHNGSNREIQSAADDYWAAVRGMKSE
jgi:hypothetical protein